MMQAEFPFYTSPGTRPYYSQYETGLPEEVCDGDLVFPAGEKPECYDCVHEMGHSCIEMAVNFGVMDFKRVYHLIQRPHLLADKYRIALEVAGVNCDRN